MLGCVSGALKFKPAFREIIVFSLFRAATEVYFDDKLMKLGDNPFHKTLVREVPAVPGIIVNTASGQEFGNTGIRNDVVTATGSILKPICKFAFIYPSFQNESSTEHEIKANAATANYLCDPISAVAGVLSEARQMADKTDVHIFQFFLENAEMSWGVKILIGGPLQTRIAHSASDVVSYLDYAGKIKNISYHTENIVLTNVFGLVQSNFSANDNVWQKIEMIHEANKNETSPFVDYFILATSFCSKLTIDVLNTEIITTLARAGYGIFKNVYHEFSQEVHVVLTALVVEELIDIIGKAPLVDNSECPGFEMCY